ncbi:MAG: hypothetical protein DCC49_05050, partial [Acidobacteria bacterium]
MNADEDPGPHEYSARLFLKPLAFPSIDPKLEIGTDGEVAADNLLSDLTTPGVDGSVEALQKRYAEITEQESGINIVPAEAKILAKVIWPLRHAKVSYVLGNSVGTIALCGMAGEMLALLIFDVHRPKFAGSPIEAKDEKGIFGREFEKLGQERRLKVLKTLRVLKDEHYDRFTRLIWIGRSTPSWVAGRFRLEAEQRTPRMADGLS